ncbi:hypothetical protein B0T14DRAFT_140285 [Immersiella caudata]|uniref:Uncharacterized protein n=1 Tax=Immersiella caudata TaxID=314043 RepID=A0AA39X5R1_9PEZI|nr:hypothetical protein B0T14DRAFT_140285 [Immersiella caudata]
MSQFNRRALPFEERDQADQAEAWYNDPLRAQVRDLADENRRLKKLLTSHNISWSSLATFDDRFPESQSSPSVARVRRMTRSSTSKAALERDPRMPSLPVEIQLKILEVALTSDYPILDPLSKITKEHTTVDERSRGNQIAIGFLATCKAYHAEGTRFLWKNNEFVFTSHHALRNLANLGPEYRKTIKSIALRIIARYYDDAKRTRRAKSNITGKTIPVKAVARVYDNPLARKGYKSYTWLQLIDFLDALRPPFDPQRKKKWPRPRMLPGLESMRMDFVNFPKEYLNSPDIDLHRLAAHDLGCTLNELMLTGLPEDLNGTRALTDLTGLVRDDGLIMKSPDTFISDYSHLTRMKDCPLDFRVVRAWKPLADEIERQFGDSDHEHDRGRGHGHHHPDVAPAPPDVGHPESIWMEKKTIWRRVPKSRDAARHDRSWIEFSRTFGLPVDPDEDDFDESFLLFCEGCGEVHEPMSDHDI